MHKITINFQGLRKRFNYFMREWEELIKVLISRSIDPFQSVNFVLYFLFIVVGIGGIGSWLNLAKDGFSSELYTSISTFSLTLAAASFADVILCNKPSIENNDNVGGILLTFPYTCFFVFIAASSITSLVICVFFPNVIPTGKFFAKISFCSSLFFWWQVNSNNPRLAKKDFDPEDTFGDQDQINAKETAGFKV